MTDTEVTLTWPSLAGNTYEVYFSPDLSGWTSVASAYPADDPGSSTDWTKLLSELIQGSGAGGILARYDAQAGGNGDFNTTAFDSVDTDTLTTATRLSQGGSLTGGGASAFVLANAIFDTSDSGSPGFNLADVTGADQAAAAAAGDFFSFTLQSSGDAVVYQSLTFYANQYGTTNKVDISYRIGAGSEVFILQNLLPTTGNAPVTLETVDFDDFSTSEDVTWTFYLHGASQSNFGTRFDDMTLYGESSPSTGNESVDRGFFRVELLP